MERDEKTLGKVVQMVQQAGAGQRIVAEMRAYWEALRRGRLVPARSDVDPRGIERALEYAFIIERVAPGMGRFRLAGMHLNDLMGMEVRGMPLTAMFTPEGRRRIAEVTEAMFQDPAIVELTLRAETGIGKPPLNARLLLLPLKSDLGDITRALGCLVAEGEAIGRTPRRFEVMAAQVAPIVQGADTPAPAPVPVNPAALGLHDPAPAFGKPAPAAQPQRPAIAPRTPEERRAMFRLVRADD